MSTTTTSPPLVQAPRRRWRGWRIALVLVVLALATPTALVVYSSYTTRSAWAQAEADAARDLPRWRLLELDEDRPKIPDAENSAAIIIDTRRKAGAAVVAGAPHYQDIFEKLTPTAQLNAQQIRLIERELDKIPGALAEARKLKDMPRGRIAVTFQDDFISTLLPDHQNARTLADWLQHDAMLRAQDEEIDQALESCQALLNASRVFHDDPFLIAHLIRLTLERVLAQGQASAAALQKTQAMLEKELREPGFLAAVRGERAGFHHLFDNIRVGKIESTWVSKAGLGTRGNGIMNDLTLWLGDRIPSTLLKYYPEFLGYMNRYVEAAKLPLHERRAALSELEAEIRECRNPMVLMLAPALTHVSENDLRNQAMLRTGLAALASERYRLANKAWPASLDDLVKAKLLDAVPLDPFDGQPIRMARMKDGMVIYSIGHDRKDNGGHIDREHPINAGVDIGFRLWNVERRRQPPLPAVELPDER
jgi:hypothetical protein